MVVTQENQTFALQMKHEITMCLWHIASCWFRKIVQHNLSTRSNAGLWWENMSFLVTFHMTVWTSRFFLLAKHAVLPLQIPPLFWLCLIPSILCHFIRFYCVCHCTQFCGPNLGSWSSNRMDHNRKQPPSPKNWGSPDTLHKTMVHFESL